MCIVVDAPGFDLSPGIVDGQELRDVQAFVAQSAIERLYVPVLSGFSRADEVGLHAASVGPVLENSRREPDAVIHRVRQRYTCAPQLLDHANSGASRVPDRIFAEHSWEGASQRPTEPRAKLAPMY